MLLPGRPLPQPERPEGLLPQPERPPPRSLLLLREPERPQPGCLAAALPQPVLPRLILRLEGPRQVLEVPLPV